MFIPVIVLAGGLLAALAGAKGATFTLELKRLEPLKPSVRVPPSDYIFRMGNPQHFFTQLGGQDQPSGAAAEFSKVVTREPAKYNAQYPLRAVAKLAHIDGKLYDLKVFPGGDKLTLTLSTVGVGQVSFPYDGFQATVYSDKGLLKISGGKSDSVPLPAGDWKLLSYTIDQTEAWKQAQEKQEKSQQRSLLKTLADALVAGPASSGPRSQTTLLAADGSKGCKVLKVIAGQTARVPFGPPYRPIVTASTSLRAGQTVRLGLSLVGSGGESCSQLTVDGKRPEKPEFEITTPDGQQVASGNFEWG